MKNKDFSELKNKAEELDFLLQSSGIDIMSIGIGHDKGVYHICIVATESSKTSLIPDNYKGIPVVLESISWVALA